MTVPWQSTSHTTYVASADRLAGSLRQAEFVRKQGEKWNEDERQDWDGVVVTAENGDVRGISHSFIYHLLSNIVRYCQRAN